MHYTCVSNQTRFLSFWDEHKHAYSQSGSELFPKVCVCVCVSSFFWKKGCQCGVQVLCSQAELLYLFPAFCIQSLPPDTGRWQVSSKAGPSHLFALLLCPSRIDSISLYSTQTETWRPYWGKQLICVFETWNREFLSLQPPTDWATVKSCLKRWEVAVYSTNKTHTLPACRGGRWRSWNRPRILWNPADLGVLRTQYCDFHNSANKVCSPVNQGWGRMKVCVLESHLGSSREDLPRLLVIFFQGKWTHWASSARKWPSVKYWNFYYQSFGQMSLKSPDLFFCFNKV